MPAQTPLALPAVRSPYAAPLSSRGPVQDAPVWPPGGPSRRPALWPPLGAGPSWRTVGLLGLAGAWGGATLLAPLGLQWTLLGTGALGVLLDAVRRDPALAGARLGRGDRILLGLALALLVVPALRDDQVLAVLSILASLGLVAIVTHGAERAGQVLLSGAVALGGAVRSWGWLGARAKTAQVPVGSRRVAGGVGRGLLIGLPGALLVGALLASADAAYGDLLRRLGPSVDGMLPVRMVVSAVVIAVVGGAIHGLARTPRWRPSQPVTPWQAAEWATPVLLLDGLLGLWLVVQAGRLVGLHPSSAVADRAREGFFQLVIVTVVVVLTLVVSGLRADLAQRGQRRLLVGILCVTTAFTLVVVGSALERMVRYEQAYGATVLRLEVAVAEVWLGVVLVVGGIAWMRQRASRLPRAIVGSAAIVLLGLGIAGPEALVARWNVERFERTGAIDVGHARQLSADAVPELSRLPEPWRSCALAGALPAPSPWYAANLARERARAVLAGAPTGTCLTSVP